MGSPDTVHHRGSLPSWCTGTHKLNQVVKHVLHRLTACHRTPDADVNPCWPSNLVGGYCAKSGGGSLASLRRAGRHKQPHRPLPRPMSSPDESHPLVGSPSPIDLTNGRASATMKVAAVAHFAEQADAGHSWQTCINVANVATCNCKWAAELRNPLC